MYFLPLPQGQGSLRPTLGASRRTVTFGNCTSPSPAGAPASAERGKVFFNSSHGGEWSCASCHNTPPTTEGKHPNTGKVIPPLAPSFNAKTFTDVAKADKWFRRNCNDVLKRECTAPEKADVMAYLLSLKP